MACYVGWASFFVQRQPLKKKVQKLPVSSISKCIVLLTTIQYYRDWIKIFQVAAIKLRAVKRRMRPTHLFQKRIASSSS